MKKVISLDPLYSEIYAELGYTLVRSGQFEQARVALNQSVALAAESPFSYYVLADSFLIEGNLEKAWQTIELASSNLQEIQGFYLDIQLLVARAQSNAGRIDKVLDNYMRTDSQSLGPLFSRGLVYLDTDEHDKLNALIVDMKERLQVAERERPEAEATLLSAIQLYGLQKDRAKLAAAVAAFNAGVKPDALRITENRSIPIAYAIAGDSEALLNLLEEILEQYGPWEFYYFAIEPSFDNMRDLPRFKALDKRYQQWLEQQS